MKILYFTASGNSLAVAKRFDAERLSIPQMIREKHYEVVDDDAIGIVYPVYNAGLPYIVRNYLEQCRIEAPYKNTADGDYIVSVSRFFYSKNADVWNGYLS